MAGAIVQHSRLNITTRQCGLDQFNDVTGAAICDLPFGQFSSEPPYADHSGDAMEIKAMFYCVNITLNRNSLRVESF